MIHWHCMDTPQRIEAIKLVYRKGMSAAQIFSLLPGCPSRNSIIGIYHRYAGELKRYPLRHYAKGIGPMHEPRKPPTEKEIVVKPPRVVRTKPMPVFPVDNVEPVSMNLTIDQFTSRSCKWPTHGPDEIGLTYFCGHPREVDRSYCPYHQRRSVSRGTESERAAHRVLAKHAAEP